MVAAFCTGDSSTAMIVATSHSLRLRHVDTTCGVPALVHQLYDVWERMVMGWLWS